MCCKNSTHSSGTGAKEAHTVRCGYAPETLGCGRAKLLVARNPGIRVVQKLKVLLLNLPALGSWTPFLGVFRLDAAKVRNSSDLLRAWSAHTTSIRMFVRGWVTCHRRSQPYPAHWRGACANARFVFAWLAPYRVKGFIAVLKLRRSFC